jgi:hypothetical protein
MIKILLTLMTAQESGEKIRNLPRREIATRLHLSKRRRANTFCSYLMRWSDLHWCGTRVIMSSVVVDFHGHSYGKFELTQ